MQKKCIYRYIITFVNNFIMDYIGQIIREEVDKLIIAEKVYKPGQEEAFKKIRSLQLKYQHKGYSDKEALNKAIKKYKEKLKKKKESEFRLKKKKGGGRERYNYSRYKEKNRDVSSGDYRQLADRIDQDNTDIAAVAREILPDHTDEGAQSQLRKILNGERPMTSVIAQRLELSRVA